MPTIQGRASAPWDAAEELSGRSPLVKRRSLVTRSSPDKTGILTAVPTSQVLHPLPLQNSSPPQEGDYPIIFTLNEAAKFLRCSKAHLSNVVNEKVPSLPPFPCIRIGRRKLVRRESLMRWVESVESRRVLS